MIYILKIRGKIVKIVHGKVYCKDKLIKKQVSHLYRLELSDRTYGPQDGYLPHLANYFKHDMDLLYIIGEPNGVIH